MTPASSQRLITILLLGSVMLFIYTSHESLYLAIYVATKLDIKCVLHQININNIKRSNIAHVTFE